MLEIIFKCVYTTDGAPLAYKYCKSHDQYGRQTEVNPHKNVMTNRGISSQRNLFYKKRSPSKN